MLGLFLVCFLKKLYISYVSSELLRIPCSHTFYYIVFAKVLKLAAYFD